MCKCGLASLYAFKPRLTITIKNSELDYSVQLKLIIIYEVNGCLKLKTFAVNLGDIAVTLGCYLGVHNVVCLLTDGRRAVCKYSSLARPSTQAWKHGLEFLSITLVKELDLV